MDSLPKLLPSWNDISLQHLVRGKGNSKYAHLHSADYGGVGVDVTENSICTVPKYFKSRIQVASEKCALPFFPAKQSEYYFMLLYFNIYNSYIYSFAAFSN